MAGDFSQLCDQLIDRTLVTSHRPNSDHVEDDAILSGDAEFELRRHRVDAAVDLIQYLHTWRKQ